MNLPLPRRGFVQLGLVLLVSAFCASAAERPSALKALVIAGGGYHDYEKLVPYLTAQIGQRVHATFEVKFGLEVLRDPKFAEAFDVVVYDMCDERAPDESLENALRAAREGKPTVMIHCALHAFRHSPMIRDWETYCGLRSKVHDPFAPFTVSKLDPGNPITKAFPSEWITPGDELYQMISIDPQSHPLLKGKSAKDGREHVVCWTSQFGKGRVFATTLGHDMKTTSTPEFIRLMSDGLLWACGKLEPDGRPAAGYGAAAEK